MTAIKRWLWTMVKPAVAGWLRDRALRLPADEAQRMAQDAGVTVAAVQRVNDAFAARVLGALEAFRP